MGLRQLQQRSTQGRSGRSSNQSRAKSNPAPVTGESDWRSVYRRRRFPRQRRRRWVSFVRKTQAVIDKSFSPSFFVATRAATVDTTSNHQSTASIHTILGGNNSSVQEGYDIGRIHSLVDNFGSEGQDVEWDPERFRVTGWLAETQIVNASPWTVYVDAYYWRTKRDLPVLSGTDGASFGLFLNRQMADTIPNFPTAGSAVDIDDYGVTPYQNARFAKNFTIYKKTRMKLGGGSTAQIEQRSGRNYFFDWKWDRQRGFRAGVTEGIFFIVYGTPGLDEANVFHDLARPSEVHFASNVNYTYRVVRSAVSTAGAQRT